MDARGCPAAAGAGEVQGWFAMFFSSITVLGSSTAAWALLCATVGFVFNVLRANARLRARTATLEGKCSEHELLRRRSAGKVADSIGSLRARNRELESELEEAHLQAGEADLRVAQLHNQVEELHRANALTYVHREELSATLRSQRLSLSHSRAEKQRSEEECRSIHADKVAAINELASERQVSNSLRREIEELNELLQEAREGLQRGMELQREAHLALPWRGNAELEHFAEALGRGKEGLDEVSIERIAELLVLELPPHSSDAVERQRAQRQLLTCLHPDKWPSSRVATRLMQEVQRTPHWLAIGQRGGA